MQHACATDLDNESRIKPALSKPLVGRTNTPSLGRLQPTLSYCGSKLWHWLTFQELRHLEHHDFPWVPWVPSPSWSASRPSSIHQIRLPRALYQKTVRRGSARRTRTTLRVEKVVGRARARAAASTARYDAPVTTKTGRGGVRYVNLRKNGRHFLRPYSVCPRHGN